MNQDLPQVKTVKLLFVGMDEQQQAMFKMAFRMHSTTNYQVLSLSSEEEPELVIVDVDKPSGLMLWKGAKVDYPNSVVVLFSKTPPAVTAPYLPKPIKFDTLFVNLRNLLQGNGLWVAHYAAATQAQSFVKDDHEDIQPGSHIHNAQEQLSYHSRAAELTINRFDPNTGLLGAFRKVLEQQKDVAILVNDKPVLVVFPTIQRVWVATDSVHLKDLCRQEHLDIKIKAVAEENNLQDRANATVLSSMWQIALWTANGRLVSPINPNTVFRLKAWPNLTRLAPLPESMRLSAFLTKTAVSLNMLYKLLPSDMSDILNYIAATYLTDYLDITQQTQETSSNVQHSATQAMVSTNAVTPQQEQIRAAKPLPQQQRTSGLLGRLMKKLLNK